jgi:hypothetical protein
MIEEQAFCRIYRMGQKRDVSTIHCRMQLEKVLIFPYYSLCSLAAEPQLKVFRREAASIQEQKKNLASLNNLL